MKIEDMGGEKICSYVESSRFIPGKDRHGYYVLDTWNYDEKKPTTKAFYEALVAQRYFTIVRLDGEFYKVNDTTGERALIPESECEAFYIAAALKQTPKRKNAKDAKKVEEPVINEPVEENSVLVSDEVVEETRESINEEPELDNVSPAYEDELPAPSEEESLNSDLSEYCSQDSGLNDISSLRESISEEPMLDNVSPTYEDELPASSENDSYDSPDLVGEQTLSLDLSAYCSQNSEFDDISYLEDEEKLEDKLAKMTAKRVKKSRKFGGKKKKRFGWKKILISAIVALLGLTACKVVSYQSLENQVARAYSEDSQVLFDLYAKVLKENETINDSLAKEILECIKLISKYELSLENNIKIMQNIRNTKFYNADKLSKTVLATIFDINDNKDYIVDELYNNYYGKVTSAQKYQLISNFLSLSTEACTEVINGANVSDTINRYFNVSDTMVLDNRLVTDGDGLIYKEYMDSFEQRAFVNISDECELRCNIFDNNVKGYDTKKKCYFYFEKETLEGISSKVYLEKLFNLVQEKSSLDYNNTTDRALVYLYANACAVNASKNEGIVTIDDMLMATHNSNSVVSFYDSMSFLSGNELNRNNIHLLARLCAYGSESIPLLQEVNLCMKKDLEDGLIDIDCYNFFVESIYSFLEGNEEIYKMFDDANNNNTSIEGYKLNLVDTKVI